VLPLKDDIMYYVDNKHNNILITGVGSKSDFLDLLIEKHLTDFPVITVNGFMSGITMKYILNKICTFLSNIVAQEGAKDLNLLDHQVRIAKRSKIQQLEYIKEVLNGEEELFPFERVYVVVYSIDGKPLRSPESQQVLSEIANSKKVAYLFFINSRSP
jgi:Origin recognition complex subunit 2